MTLVVLIAVLVAGGTYLLLDDDPVRLVLGAGLLGHGAVLGLVTVMRPGRPPIVGTGDGTVADPLPQALALTAIVIAFGVAAYLLAFTRASSGAQESDEARDHDRRDHDRPDGGRRAADGEAPLPVSPGRPAGQEQADDGGSARRGALWNG